MRRPGIGIIGDFNPEYLYHQATNHALEEAGVRLGLTVSYEWVATDSIAEGGVDRLAGFDGLWASPGSPYASVLGALEGIRFARVKGKPFVGT